MKQPTSYSEIWPYIRDFYTRKELKDFLASLDPEKREHIDKLRKRYFPRFLLQIIFYNGYVVLTIGILITGFILNSKYPSSIIIAIICFISLIVFFILITTTALNIAIRKKVKNPKVGKGIVFSCHERVGYSSKKGVLYVPDHYNIIVKKQQPRRQNRFDTPAPTRFFYKVLIAVDGVDHFLWAITRKRYNRGEKVTIQFNEMKSHNCHIVNLRNPDVHSMFAQMKRATWLGKRKKQLVRYKTNNIIKDTSGGGSTTWGFLDLYDTNEAVFTFDYPAAGGVGHFIFNYEIDGDNLILRRALLNGKGYNLYSSLFSICGAELKYRNVYSDATGVGKKGDFIFQNSYDQFIKYDNYRCDKKYLISSALLVRYETWLENNKGSKPSKKDKKRISKYLREVRHKK